MKLYFSPIGHHGSKYIHLDFYVMKFSKVYSIASYGNDETHVWELDKGKYDFDGAIEL